MKKLNRNSISNIFKKGLTGSSAITGTVTRFIGCLYLLAAVTAMQTANSQTVLTGGDIAFVGYNSEVSSADEFAFMLLKDVSAGTTITFTDHLWLSTGGFYINTLYGACNTEAFLNWTATSALPLGTVVVIANPGGVSPNPSMATATTGTVFVAGGCPDLSFPTSGDVLYAYQGTMPVDNTATNFLAAINMDGAWLTGASQSTSAGALPTNLSTAHVLLLTPEVDNAVYRGNLTGTAAALRTAINNPANWATDDVTPFALPADIGPLPVTWYSFTAAKKEKTVGLQWQTATEQHSDHFTVQASYDGSSYRNLGTIKAAGNSETIQTYNFTDEHPFAGTNYYRILQADVDGSVRYSKTIIFNMEHDGQDIIIGHPSPNPAGSYVNIICAKGACEIKLYSADGRQLLTRNLPEAGSYQLQLPPQYQGILILEASLQDGRRQHFRIVKN
ncbi:hypothetical protein [Niastella populi]|uniref:Secretion system C-terminal sorting domain-containing protein n=1 Tax=Niastella populi TaxID=550983 RepID=A0A1V9G1R3_9BACT|nr:hypothetical protein [Niastella populi]OQP64553.1 hypothetical protein A4R26_16010 [Niastella populi]